MKPLLNKLEKDIKELRAMVVGAGALGSELCQQLAAAGVRRVTVVDPDLLELHNVVSSPVYQTLLEQQGISAIGQSKANLLVDFLREQYQSLEWVPRCEEIADIGFGDLQACDAVLSCPDSTLARVETARATQALQLPMIDGGVMPHNLREGRVSYFPGNRIAACYLCGLSEVRRAEVLAYATSSTLSCRANPEPGAMTGTLSAVRMVASGMVDRLRKLASTGASPTTKSEGASTDCLSSRNLSRIDLAPLWETHKLVRSADCPWHEFEARDQLVSMREGQTFDDIFNSLAFAGHQVVLELPWPICLEARCSQCGFTDRPLKRIAVVRRKLSCPSCGKRGQWEPLERLATLKHGDAEARSTPRQLGLPANHRFKLRCNVVVFKKGRN